MSRTLKNISFEAISQDQEAGSQAGRLVTNSLQAIGIATPVEETIQSRIYLAYVLGRLVAVAKYGWRKMDLGKV